MDSSSVARPTTLGGLRAAGYPDRTVKEEVAINAAARLREGVPLVDGLVGFEDTVVPALETALLAGHDLILLGERGQAKSRIVRSLTSLLDDAVPVIAGSEVNDHPYHPFTPAARRLVDEHGEDTPIEWIGREQRYAEKLATPDIAVADLVGDVDPIKVAEGRYLGDDETIHFGLVPRHNRGIIAINELPDLAERIQVALLNVMEERDIQVRGYSLRLPLDLLVVATANPEDYTNRGRIITPLKDRFGSEIRTHYPQTVDQEVTVMQAEGRLPAHDGLPAVVVPTFMAEVLAAFTRSLRTAGEDTAVARPSDLPAVIAAAMGKIEFESFEEGREAEIMTRLLRRSILEVFRRRVRGPDVAGLLDAFETGLEVTTGDLMSGRDLMAQLDRIPGLAAVLGSLDVEETPAMAAAAVELCLEGLHLSRRLDRYESDAGYTYVQP